MLLYIPNGKTLLYALKHSLGRAEVELVGMENREFKLKLL